MRLVARITLEELSAGSGVKLGRVMEAERNRIRLRMNEAARLYATLFEVLACRLRALPPGAESPCAVELDRALESLSCLNVEDFGLDSSSF